MNVYQFAMQMEKDGEAYYRECADKTASAGLRTILLMLAGAEVAHYELFRRMQAREEALLADSPLLEQVKNIFAEDQGARGGPRGCAASEVELYRKAQEIERRELELYEGHAAQGAASPAEKLTFERIAVEERRALPHPGGDRRLRVAAASSWLENAEWTHLEDY